MPGSTFSVHARPGDDGTVVELSGELDAEAAPLLRRWLDDFEPDGVVQLDTAGLTFMDSTGLGCLYKLHYKVADAGGLVVVPRPPAAIRRLLEIAGLHRVIAVTD